MKIAQWLKKLAPSSERKEVPGAPQSLHDYEKQFVVRKQDELDRTLQILELETEVVSRKS